MTFAARQLHRLGVLDFIVVRRLAHRAVSTSLTSCPTTAVPCSATESSSARPLECLSGDAASCESQSPQESQTQEAALGSCKTPLDSLLMRSKGVEPLASNNRGCTTNPNSRRIPFALHLLTGPLASCKIVSPSVYKLGASFFQQRAFSTQAHIVRTSTVAPAILGWRPSLEELERDERKRRACQVGPSHRALLVDAAGTLLAPSEPAAQVYKTLGRKYGVTISEDDILRRYRWAYSQPWSESHLRYVDDARFFWASVIKASTGCSDPQYFEDLYQYYASARAWRLIDPNAGEAFAALRDAGVKIAVVSNFDTRLRPILEQLGCDHWFDALAISAEVQAEKPNPTIFLRACELLGVAPEEAVHVGDDRRNDLWGARDAGCDAWLWGDDVTSFADVATRMGVAVAEAEEPLVA